MADQQNRRRKYPYSKIISPSTLKKFEKSLPGALAEEMIYKSGTSGVVSAYGAPTGAIHSALEESFNYIIAKKKEYASKSAMPGTDVVEKIVAKAESLSKKRLAFGAGVHRSHYGFAKDVIRNYGKQLLEDPTLTGFTEKELSSNKFSPNTRLSGNIDLLLVKNLREGIDGLIADSLLIVDWKSFADIQYTNFMNLHNDIQHKAYSVMGRETFNTNNVQSVYAINRSAYDDIMSRSQANRMAISKSERLAKNVSKTMNTVYFSPQSNLDEFENEIAVRVAEVETQRMIAYEKQRSYGKEGLTRYINDILWNKGNGPSCTSACSHCVLRETCPYSNLVTEAMERGITGEVQPKSLIRKVDDVVKEGTTYQDPEEYTRALEDRTDIRASNLRKERKQELLSEGYSNSVATARANEEALALRESIHKVHKGAMSSFQDTSIRGAMAARGKLPFSLLDKEIDLGWMSQRTKQAIEATSYRRIDEVADVLGVKPGIIREQVMENVFRDKEMAGKLINHIYSRSAHELYKANPFKWKTALGGFDMRTFNVYERKALLEETHAVIDRSFVDIINANIDQQTVLTSLAMEEEAISRHIGTDQVRELFASGKVEELTKGIDLSNLETNGEKVLEEIHHTSNRRGIIGRLPSSKNRVPMSMMFASMSLVWMMSNITSFTQVANKVKKMTDFVTTTDDRIEALPHHSTYTSVRRILHSDFGSPWRKIFNTASGIAAKISVSWDKYFRGMKDLTSRTSPRGPSKIQTFLVERAKDGNTAEKMINILDKYPLDNPYVIGTGAAIGGFISTGFLAHMYLDRKNIGYDIDQRKKNLKYLKMDTWNKSSPSPEPESDLREGYKLHTPFGSATYIDDMYSFFVTQIKKVDFENLYPDLIDRWDDARKYLSESSGKITGILKARSKDIANEASKETTGIGAAEKLKARVRQKIVAPLKAIAQEAEQKGYAAVAQERGRNMWEGAQSIAESKKLETAAVTILPIAGGIPGAVLASSRKSIDPDTMPIIKREGKTTTELPYVVSNRGGIDDVSHYASPIKKGSEPRPFVESSPDIARERHKLPPGIEDTAVGRDMEPRRMTAPPGPEEGLARMKYDKPGNRLVSNMRGVSANSTVPEKRVTGVVPYARRGVYYPYNMDASLPGKGIDTKRAYELSSTLVRQHKRLANHSSYAGAGTYRYEQMLFGR